MIPQRNRISATTANGSQNDDLTTHDLAEAAKRTGSVERFALIPVIGAYIVALAYFRLNAVAERFMAESSAPYTAYCGPLNFTTSPSLRSKP